MFVNSRAACLALHGKNENALPTANYFCEQLHLFGYDDWRLSTLEEMIDFSQSMDAEGLVPYFTFPQCKRVTGVKPGGTLGACNTHNATPKFAEVPLRLPAGVRCVREE